MSPSRTTRSTPRVRWTAWAPVCLLVALIYASLPWGPWLWRTLRRATGDLVNDLAVASLLLLVVAAALYLRANRRRLAPSPGRIGGLLLVAAAYVIALATVPMTPAERLHFLYYGLLGYLALRAFSIDMAAVPARLSSMLLVALVGLGDEAIQWALPRRVFEWKDVWINLAAGVLAVSACALLGLGSRPDGPESTAERRG